MLNKQFNKNVVKKRITNKNNFIYICYTNKYIIKILKKRITNKNNFIYMLYKQTI